MLKVFKKKNSFVNRTCEQRHAKSNNLLLYKPKTFSLEIVSRVKIFINAKLNLSINYFSCLIKWIFHKPNDNLRENFYTKSSPLQLNMFFFNIQWTKFFYHQT